ncbi:MAG: 4-(cytidine 5'-diphospho)-2-C-methyl-D-erythritol kinase [Rikenellaceae bacterium]
MIFTAPCKVNLGLNITKKREDGYHEIYTVMAAVEKCCDLVEITYRDDSQVVFSSSGIEIDCPAEDNLCVKAYNEFKKHFDIKGVNIHLHKVVPFGAGLGSGSSDATAVLKGLNEMFDCGASEDQIKEMAATLGSDTVFFVNNITKLCEGRGEKLTELELDLKGLYITLVKPDISISTKFAYSGIIPKNPEFDIVDVLKTDLSQWKGKLVNDFENHIFNSYPELENIKNLLYDSGADYVSMSGSGSTIFALSKIQLNVKNLTIPIYCYFFNNIL